MGIQACGTRTLNHHLEKRGHTLALASLCPAKPSSQKPEFSVEKAIVKGGGGFDTINRAEMPVIA